MVVGLCDFVLLVTLSLSLDTCTPIWTGPLLYADVLLGLCCSPGQNVQSCTYMAHAQSGFAASVTSVVGQQCFLYSSFLYLIRNELFEVRVLQDIGWDESNECLIREGVRLCLFECVVVVLSKTPVRITRLGGRELNLKYDTLTSELVHRAIVFPFPASSRDFCFLQRVQDGFGSHPASSYSMCIGDSSPGGKAAEG